MTWVKALLCSLLLSLAACNTVAPTPLLMGRLVDANDKVIALYVDCSTGANYTPEKESCDPPLLQEKVDSTMDLAKEFISADIKQPPGYDVYLAVAMINFRIGQRNILEYTEAERIARQFFEMQKATSGRSLTTAGFYWAALAAARASLQWYNDRLALDADRKTELLLALAAGRASFNDLEDGPRRVRLFQYLQVLEGIIDAI